MKVITVTLAIAKATKALMLNTTAHTATVYLTPKLVVRVTRLHFREYRGSLSQMQLAVTVGRPNYAAQKFIAMCKVMDEPFPIKKVHLNYLRSK